MKIQDLKFTYNDLIQNLDVRRMHKIIDYKLNEAGYYKCVKLAEMEGLTKQTLSARIKAHPENYETIDFGSNLYAKKK